MWSMPRPRARNGTICVVVALKGRPSTAQSPRPAATETVTRSMPAIPTALCDLTASCHRTSDTPTYTNCSHNNTILTYMYRIVKLNNNTKLILKVSCWNNYFCKTVTCRLKINFREIRLVNIFLILYEKSKVKDFFILRLHTSICFIILFHSSKGQKPLYDETQIWYKV